MAESKIIACAFCVFNIWRFHINLHCQSCFIRDLHFPLFGLCIFRMYNFFSSRLGLLLISTFNINFNCFHYQWIRIDFSLERILNLKIFKVYLLYLSTSSRQTDRLFFLFRRSQFSPFLSRWLMFAQFLWCLPWR